jgi:hypothetical protein
MTTDDRSKAALATALLTINKDPEREFGYIDISWADGDEEYHELAAAILGERGVFWPTGKDEYRELIRQRETAAVAAERARIAGSVMELPAVEGGRAEWNPDWISRAAVLAIVEEP